MKLEEFRPGIWRNRLQYKSFEPSFVNHEWTWDDARINMLLESATKALGELNAFSLILPDIDMYIQMSVVKEAQRSSRIEGTRTEFDEALMSLAQIAPEKRDDWQEVQNYIQAMNGAIEELQRLPLSNRLLKNAHATLLTGVRGEHKQPGEFRNSQNWIGGHSLEDAVFIPPHQERLGELMGDLEEFWHNDSVQVPHLIRIAISHYQFETIHPFLDGNGRLGRLFIPLYMINHGLLEKPSLYISDYLERYRAEYYDALMRVRLSGDLVHWVRFFLGAVEETASKGRDTFRKVVALKKETDERILAMGKRAPNARDAIAVFYRRAIVSGKNLEQEIGVSAPTAISLLKDFVKMGLIEETTGRGRDRLYSFRRYLELFEK